MEADTTENFVRDILEAVPADGFPFLAAFVGVILGHLVWTVLIVSWARLARTGSDEFPPGALLAFLGFAAGMVVTLGAVMLFLVAVTGI